MNHLRPILAAALLHAALISTAQISAYYTHFQPDGNKYVAGSLDASKASFVDVPLDSRPAWIVAGNLDQDSVWIAALADGQIVGFTLVDGVLKRLPKNLDRLPAGTPPVLLETSGNISVLPAETYRGNFLTHPILLTGSGHSAAIDSSGDLHLQGSKEVRTLRVDALPDARIIADGGGGLLILSGPTGSYRHGILGDGFEASQAVLMDLDSLHLERIDPPSGTVIEGLFPMAADLDGDGKREIVLTVSDANQGARLVVYNSEGKLKASGPAIGMGYRWLHQIAVAPFAPGGETELAVVKTPHIGGVVEYYRLAGRKLIRMAFGTGYSSHSIGSRNLDMALAADLDGVAGAELLVPNPSMTKLAVLKRVGSSVKELTALEVGGRIATNIAVSVSEDGSLSLGVGRQDGSLRIWF